ncbi:MAG: hypothetical protein HY609_02215, partial [Deltaproteobacteria bacterium]|nr:hypothetical protein [Deltaproteobacteria bacterium]
MKPQNPIYILPSEQAAERKRREMFAASKEAVWLGEEVFSLPHFLESLADPARPIFKRLTQKYLIAHCLRTTPLR